MPKYDYICTKCNKKFSLRHSISEEIKKHPDCDSSCEVKKIYSVSRVLKAKSQDKSGSKAGTIVKKHIEEAKQELKERKEKLKKEEYS